MIARLRRLVAAALLQAARSAYPGRLRVVGFVPPEGMPDEDARAAVAASRETLRRSVVYWVRSEACERVLRHYHPELFNEENCNG
ncbi:MULTISPECIES: hypothetical protein [unclassified Thioalkalivibrio]|uniref:hypothetical protein n=1 Tax=unclassified Thioalkalivibrio TaxID=2621013 RepID=UPI00036BEADE|nr:MULTISPECIES: hypothetical protein [unclassified Thioalkalivibrio]